MINELNSERKSKPRENEDCLTKNRKSTRSDAALILEMLVRRPAKESMLLFLSILEAASATMPN